MGLTDKQAKLAYPNDEFRSIRLKKTSYLEKLIGLNPLAAELDLSREKNIHFNTENQNEKLLGGDAVKSERAKDTELRNNYLKILYETKSGQDRIIGLHYLGDSAANII